MSRVETGDIEPPNPVLPYSTRNKRDLGHDILVGSAGMVIGSIFTNIITSLWDWIDPNSPQNQLKDLQIKTDQNREQLFKRMDVYSKYALNLSSELEYFENQTIKQFAMIQSEISQAAQIITMKTDIGNLLNTYERKIEELYDSAQIGQLNTDAFAEIYGIRELKRVKPSDTKFIGLNIVNKPLIEKYDYHARNNWNQPIVMRYSFRTKRQSNDSTILMIYPFEHWDNLALGPGRLMTYAGPRYVIFNSTNNCVKGIHEDMVGQVSGIQVSCKHTNYFDPQLRRWKIKNETDNYEDFTMQTQWHHTLDASYVYCWPGNITIMNTQYECPLTVMKIPVKFSFSTSDYSYEPSIITNNLTINLNKVFESEILDPLDHLSAQSVIVDDDDWVHQVRDQRRKAMEEMKKELEKPVLEDVAKVITKHRNFWINWVLPPALGIFFLIVCLCWNKQIFTCCRGMTGIAYQLLWKGLGNTLAAPANDDNEIYGRAQPINMDTIQRMRREVEEEVGRPFPQMPQPRTKPKYTIPRRAPPPPKIEIDEDDTVWVRPDKYKTHFVRRASAQSTRRLLPQEPRAGPSRPNDEQSVGDVSEFMRGDLPDENTFSPIYTDTTTPM